MQCFQEQCWYFIRGALRIVISLDGFQQLYVASKSGGKHMDIGCSSSSRNNPRNHSKVAEFLEGFFKGKDRSKGRTVGSRYTRNLIRFVSCNRFERLRMILSPRLE